MYPQTANILAPTIPESVFFIFQMTFAIITPALICGGLAERMRFSALIIFMAAWSLLVYSPVAHSVWFTDFNLANTNNGFLTYGRLYPYNPSGKVWPSYQFKAGIIDFAGGSVVHINSGVAALVAAIMLGRRHGLGKIPLEPHNLSVSLIGASLLWVGWFGFNAGSAGAANWRAGYALATTQIATAAAGLSWMFTEWIVKGKPTVLSIISGAVAGLVVITPASGFVDMTGAMLMGFFGGILCFASVQVKHKLGYDDALDAWGVHGVGGCLGALMTGLFASPDVAKPAGADFTGVFYIKRYLQLQKEMMQANTAGCVSTVMANPASYVLPASTNMTNPVSVMAGINSICSCTAVGANGDCYVNSVANGGIPAMPAMPQFLGNKNAGGVQLAMQVIGVCCVTAYSGFMTAILLKIIDLIVGIRVDIQSEVEGLDASVHGEKVFYGEHGSVHKTGSGMD